MPHRSLRRRLGRDEEVLLAQRIGMEELGPTLLGQPVLNDGLDRLSPPGNPLDHAAGRRPPSLGIEDHQFAHAAHVMARHDAHDLGGVIRDRPGVEDRIRPEVAAAVELSLARAVGVHREQPPRPDMRNVRVFPAQVQEPAVIGQGQAVIVVLIEAELTDGLAVGVHAVGHGHVDRRIARHALQAGPSRQRRSRRRASSRRRSCGCRAVRRA